MWTVGVVVTRLGIRSVRESGVESLLLDYSKIEHGMNKDFQ